MREEGGNCITDCYSFRGEMVLYMEIQILYGCLLLVVCSAIIGWMNYEEVDFVFEVKGWSNPYFQFGISFLEYSLDDGYIEQELSIGLFLFNVKIIFYKERIDT